MTPQQVTQCYHVSQLDFKCLNDLKFEQDQIPMRDRTVSFQSIPSPKRSNNYSMPLGWWANDRLFNIDSSHYNPFEDQTLDNNIPLLH